MEKNQAPLPTLPMHLMLTMGTWLASPFALQCAKSVLPNWKPELKNPKQLENALQDEVKNRAEQLLAGVLRYIETPYKRNVAEKPSIWERGNARLLDYGQDIENASEIVLFVPSLINRYYILDLEQDRSFMRYLASQNIYPLVLDWGTPGEFESDFGCEAYITNILCEAIDYIYSLSKKRVHLAGYCMGGVLSIAAAQLRPKKIASLALLATPWDFHCPEFAPMIVNKEWRKVMASLIKKNKTVPADIIQSLFYITDPFVFEHKFRRFSELDPTTRHAKDFVALEHWVNDGVPMTANVAKDCLIGWAQENQLAVGSWQIADKKIDPAKIKLPTFIAIPQNDHVVPYECAVLLTKKIKGATIINPGAGHVGMIVGSHAKRELWQPFAQWLLCAAA